MSHQHGTPRRRIVPVSRCQNETGPQDETMQGSDPVRVAADQKVIAGIIFWAAVAFVVVTVGAALVQHFYNIDLGFRIGIR